VATPGLRDSLIAEVVSAGPHRDGGWGVGACSCCHQPVRLSSSSTNLLLSHPDQAVLCVDCAALLTA